MVWTSANGPKCPVSPEDRGEFMEPAPADVHAAVREALENLLQRIDDHFGGYRGGKWDWKEQADARIALSLSRPDRG